MQRLAHCHQDNTVLPANRHELMLAGKLQGDLGHERQDRKSTRLNSSHTVISYAVFCLKKKKMVDTIHGLVDHHDQHVELVDILELDRYGDILPRHAGELGVHSEVVLDDDGGEFMVLVV